VFVRTGKYETNNNNGCFWRLLCQQEKKRNIKNRRRSDIC